VFGFHLKRRAVTKKLNGLLLLFSRHFRRAAGALPLFPSINEKFPTLLRPIVALFRRLLFASR
jgi:hypothetical protein